jgi:transcriptional regulator with GAF, ATPase, and Fis domain
VPLFERGTPRLHALLALCGLSHGYAPVEQHRALFACLLDEVADGGARRDPSAVLAQVQIVGTTPGRDALDDAQRDRIEDALAGTRGNVTAAARLLRVPLRTLKDRIRRFEVDVAAFRARPT